MFFVLCLPSQPNLCYNESRADGAFRPFDLPVLGPMGVRIMKVRDLLDTKGKDIVSIDSNSSVEDAIRAMHARKISAIMIMDHGKTLGIFTERDVVRCYIASGGKNFHDISVKEHMITELVVAVPDDDLDNVMSTMVEKNIRHLPVIDGSRVIGMLSVRDIVQTHVKKLTSEIHYLRDYIHQ